MVYEMGGRLLHLTSRRWVEKGKANAFAVFYQQRAGTLIAGEPISGKLWSFHPHPLPTQVLEHTLPGISLTNGIVWHVHDRSKFYCIDAMNNVIVSVGYDAVERKVTGIIAIIFQLDPWYLTDGHLLYPGHAMLGRMTIDTKGRLYVPLNGGSHILQINPNTRIIVPRPIYIPAVKVKGCAFGGIDMNVLYVSTQAFGPNEEAPAGDQSGKIFAVSNLGKGVKGHEAWPFVMPSLYK
ncbi:regucalcin-like [Belonocnema kinseyi]|uniref:regucalcin-like n=1 Tax=Belonocnema kinseyi TaxID=2817044 RepID=UPI00143CE117|nr:regucalcin-like [Belonocnema kinseyi]